MIGPSGIGKSSLLRAGVASAPPPGWRVVVFTPGESPTLSMARALAPDHAGDPAAVSKLVGFTDPDIALAVVSRWRGRFEDAVLVIDQFEELFTLNPPEVQTGFVALLRRLVDAADIHIVLAMRDDFLYQCQRFPEIAPIFRDLTPLGPPGADALRRALTEPAARRLHRFESEVLVDRMVGEVEDQRSALPLLAFAVHRLWEKRDREDRLLTETAYESIGGVAGALARHAEETVDRIGNERIPIVREIFRNLVTAEGTRAVRDVDELLSVFDRPCHPERSGLRGRGVKGPSGCGDLSSSRRHIETKASSVPGRGSFDSVVELPRPDDTVKSRPAREVLATATHRRAATDILRDPRGADETIPPRRDQSTSHCSPPGRGWSAGRPRMPTPPNSATSSARRLVPGTSAAAPTIFCGQAPPTVSTACGASTIPVGSASTRKHSARP